MKQLTKGIFIHKTSYSESSLIATFYSEELGLCRFLYQGGKKNAAVLFPCSICELTYFKRPDSELAKLTSVVPINLWHVIPHNPIHGTVAFFLADIIRNVIKGEYKDRSLFHFLNSYIEKVDRLDVSELPLAVIYFLIKLTSYMGIEPQVSEGEIKPYFLPAEGVFSDIERKETITLSGAGVNLIQHLLIEKEITEIRTSERREALSFLLTYYKLHIPSFNVDRTLEVLREILYN